MNRTHIRALPVPNPMVLVPLLAALLFGLSAPAWASAVSVEVVSDRKGALPLYRVDANGRDTYRAYLEAERGEKYGVRIANRTGRRIGVVVAVDGRNIISGEKSYLHHRERMYILGPYESAVYDGWRTARDTVNRFYFTEPGDSYAAAFNDRSAMGVIAVAVYREKEPSPRRSWRDLESGGKLGDDRNMAPESAPGAPSGAERKSLAPRTREESAGTGFGEESHSPSIRVTFDPERRAAERHFLKYEWRDTLCRKGILDCRYSKNRFWDDDGYAPYPPGRRPPRCE